MKARIWIGVWSAILAAAIPLSAAGQGPAGTLSSTSPAWELQILGDVATFPLAQRWGSGLQQANPRLKVQVRSMEAARTPPWWQVKGPPVAVLQAESMPVGEQNAFERLFGYPPTSLPVVLNAAAIIVHVDNPVAQRGLSLAELDAVFSVTRFRGHSAVHTWGDLGLSGDWAKRPLAAYGQDATGNLHRYFRETVLANGDFRPGVSRLASSADIVQAVANDPAGIGFAGLAYATAAVRKVPVAAEGGVAVAPEAEAIVGGRYPLHQTLRLFVNLPPGQSLEPPLRELLEFVYSSRGQEIAAALGYVPLPEEMRGNIP
jgi:phosphate transport system substrate-binding protein